MKVTMQRGKVVDGKKVKAGDTIEVDNLTAKQLLRTKAATEAGAAKKAAEK